MKLAVALALATLAFSAAPAWATDPLAGTWRTQPGKDGGFGHVEIFPCGEGLCGTVVRTFDAAGQAVAASDLGASILAMSCPQAAAPMARDASSTRKPDAAIRRA